MLHGDLRQRNDWRQSMRVKVSMIAPMVLARAGSTISFGRGVLRPQAEGPSNGGLPFPAGIPLRQEIESPQ